MDIFFLLHYLQTNKLAFHSFMNDARIHETPGSETKDSLLITATSVARL